MSVEAYIEAHSRYQGYRDAAFHLTWECMQPRLPGVDLKVLPINELALHFWGEIIRPLGLTYEAGGFRWDQIFQQIRTTPRRFDVAIWDGSVLCGMAAGKASRGGENVTVKWLERFAIPSAPLRGTLGLTALTAAESYAKIIERQWVMIRNPLPGAAPLYEKLGFELAPSRFGTPYYGRPVT
jgi:hypothetical protein